MRIDGFGRRSWSAARSVWRRSGRRALLGTNSEPTFIVKIAGPQALDGRVAGCVRAGRGGASRPAAAFLARPATPGRPNHRLGLLADAALLWERHDGSAAALYLGGAVAGAIAGQTLGPGSQGRCRRGTAPRLRRDHPRRRRRRPDVRHRAGQRGRRVLLLDHAEQVGKKILISGGGRCNFTNLHTAPERFLSANPHFCKSALARYTPARFHRPGRAARHRLAREDARPAVLRRLGARRSSPCCWPNARRPASTCGSAHRVTAIAKADRFTVETEPRRLRPRRRWCSPPAACRSRRWAPPASPTTSRAGSASARRDAAGAGAADRSKVPVLSGVSLAGVARRVVPARPRFREAMLFTHRGLSGPAILQISSYWREGQEITARPAARHSTPRSS